jgi:cephalosporin hydroxylase
MNIEEIPGWFDYPELYDRAAESVPDGGVAVEVGCWQGRSLAHLAARKRALGRRFTVVGVDHCLGSPEHEAEMNKFGGNVAGRLVGNLQRAGLLADVRLIVAKSVDAAALFADRSVDFVFIDAEHSFHAVLADLAAWVPKVKAGGVVAGHDYTHGWPGVRDAVRHYFGAGDFRSPLSPSCWECAVRVPLVNLPARPTP